MATVMRNSGSIRDGGAEGKISHREGEGGGDEEGKGKGYALVCGGKGEGTFLGGIDWGCNPCWSRGRPGILNATRRRWIVWMLMGPQRWTMAVNVAAWVPVAFRRKTQEQERERKSHSFAEMWGSPQRSLATTSQVPYWPRASRQPRGGQSRLDWIPTAGCGPASSLATVAIGLADRGSGEGRGPCGCPPGRVRNHGPTFWRGMLVHRGA